MVNKPKNKKSQIFNPVQKDIEGQIPFTGNIYTDIRIFALMNMDVKDAEYCLDVLHRNDLFDLFENTYTILKEVSKSSAAEHPRQIAELAPGLLTGVILKMNSLEDAEERALVKEMAVNMSKVILMAFVNGNRKYARDIISRITEAIARNCRQLNIDQRLMEKRFENELLEMPHWLKSNPKGNTVSASTDESYCYIWNGKGNLPELVHQLKERQYLKRTRPFFDLFEETDSPGIIEWNRKKKPHLARLLYRLFTEEFCMIRGGKGYFAYAEQRVRDFNGKPLSKNSLRKLSSKINNYPDKYTDVIDTVENILEEITLK